MFGDVSLCQKASYQERNDLFNKEIQNCRHNNSSVLRYSYEKYLREAEEFDREENPGPSCFTQGVQDNSGYSGVFTPDEESCTSMVSLCDNSPNDKSTPCFEEASFVAEDDPEKDTERDYLTSCAGEDRFTPLVPFGEFSSGDDAMTSASDVFSSTAENGFGGDVEQDYFTNIDDQLGPLGNETFSRSSLTLAASRSLDMSRSLTDRCFQMANLAVTNEGLTIDTLNLQKRRRPDLTKEPTSPVQPMEADDDSNELPSDPFVNTSLAFTASSPFQEEKRAPNEQTSPKSTQRYRIVQEIVETERKYCSCLLLLQNHFAEKLSASGSLERSDVRVIFPPCLHQIHAFHGDLFRKLEGRLMNWTKLSTIADLIILLVKSADCDLLKLYQTYVSLFPDSILHMRRLCQLNPGTERLIKELERDNCCQGLDISAYLLTPIQRIPRYVLLLKQLGKCTVEEHPDYRLINCCLAQLGGFLDKLNDSIQSSMKLVSADTSAKPKRRFNFNTMSFRYNSASNADAGHTPYIRLQKNSNSLKVNRISLDLSFLGTFKQKREPELVEKKARSEICLLESEPVESYSPPDNRLPLTPQNSPTRRSFRNQKRIFQLPSPLKKSKRKLEECNTQPATETTEVCGNLKKKPTKKTGNVDGSKSLDFSLKGVPSNVCEPCVGDTSTPEKKSKLSSLSEKLHLSPNKNGELRRKTSVRDAIKNFFIGKGSSARPDHSQHR